MQSARISRSISVRKVHFASPLLCLFWLFTLADVAQAQGNVPQNTASFDHVQAAAANLAAHPYQPQPEVPASLKNLTYDQFRFIGFIDGKELWSDAQRPFRIGFYHKGYVHLDDVSINLIENGQAVPVPFSKSYFHYLGTAKQLQIPDDLGFAGFRVQGRFPGQTKFEEIFSFVGASYFRARAERTVLGTSARGLAVNCGLPKPEEFPVFREYWIVAPQPGDTALRVWALLDSPSVAGAYEFLLTPGIENSDVEIDETLYFRQSPEKVGIAPLSSMWLWGDGLNGPQGDHRPEVHDADGLQVHEKDGKWTWRALSQQGYPSLVRLQRTSLKGFGLVQRDTDPQHYLDEEALYHQRPTVWIEPLSDWGAGAIELLELPAPHEGIDNIATWWVPEQGVSPGTPVNLKYRVSFCVGDRPEHDLGKGIAYRINREGRERMQLEIDFSGPALAARDKDLPPQVQLTSIRGFVTSTTCRRQAEGIWTAHLDVRPTGEGPVELSVVLKEGERELTETWACLCPLEPPPVSLPPWKLKEQQKESKP